MKRKINANILRWFANFNCDFPKIINYLSSEIYHENSGKFSWKIVKVLRKNFRLDWVLFVTVAQADSRQRLLWQKRLMHLTGRKSTAATSHCLSLCLSLSSPSLHFVIIQQDYAKISTPPAELQSVVVALHEVGQMQIVAKSFTQRINAQ